MLSPGQRSNVTRVARSLQGNRVESPQVAKVVTVSVAVLAVVVVEARRVTSRCLLLETPSGLLRHKFHHAGRRQSVLLSGENRGVFYGEAKVNAGAMTT